MNTTNLTSSNTSIPLNSIPLTAFISDVFNVYVLPPLCYMGVVLNLLCIIVTHKLKATKTFLYMELTSLSDFLFLLINSSLFIIRCGSLCNLGYTFGAKAYEIYIYLFIGSSLLFFSSLVEILILFDQYLTIKNRPLKFKTNMLVAVFSVISLAASTPTFLTRRIGTQNFYINGELFVLFVSTSNDLGRSNTGRVLNIAYGLYRGMALLVFLFIGNLLLTIEYHKFINKKNKITGASFTTKIYNQSRIFF